MSDPRFRDLTPEQMREELEKLPPYREPPRRGGVILPERYDAARLRAVLREALDAMLALWAEFATTGQPPALEHRAHVARLIGQLGDCHAGSRPHTREPDA